MATSGGSGGTGDTGVGEGRSEGSKRDSGGSSGGGGGGGSKSKNTTGLSAGEVAAGLSVSENFGNTGITMDRTSKGLRDASDKSFAEALNMANTPPETGLFGLDMGTFAKYGALLAVAPELGPVIGLAAIASAIGGSLPGIADQLGTGTPNEFEGPQQKGTQQAQSERGGPVAEREKQREDANPDQPELSDKFSTPLFDQIMQNILDGKSPLEALTSKFEGTENGST